MITRYATKAESVLSLRPRGWRSSDIFDSLLSPHGRCVVEVKKAQAQAATSQMYSICDNKARYELALLSPLYLFLHKPITQTYVIDDQFAEG